MTDRDHVRELADLDELSKPDWDSLTDEERDEYMALMAARIAHGKEKLEALQEDNRILKILLRLDVGQITTLEAVQQIRGAVPDPLAQRRN